MLCALVLSKRLIVPLREDAAYDIMWCRLQCTVLCTLNTWGAPYQHEQHLFFNLPCCRTVLKSAFNTSNA